MTQAWSEPGYALGEPAEAAFLARGQYNQISMAMSVPVYAGLHSPLLYCACSSAFSRRTQRDGAGSTTIQWPFHRSPLKRLPPARRRRADAVLAQGCFPPDRVLQR
jgi:hypothetical protein